MSYQNILFGIFLLAINMGIAGFRLCQGDTTVYGFHVIASAVAGIIILREYENQR